MAAGDAHVIDPVDPVHHEMNSMLVYSNYVHKAVRLPVIGKQLVVEKEPDGQSTQ